MRGRQGVRGESGSGIRVAGAVRGDRVRGESVRVRERARY